jgi:enterochelin esterase-like enzyme
VFGLSAAQSPAYWYLGDSLFTIARQAGNVRARFYIDAGTLEPAPAKAREMRDLLRETGNEVRYGEYPEGHNWGNWSARLDDILEFFWGKR